ncbi:MAG: adenine deaminase [Deltaproteobacteria bacterium]|nr:adenine deaminase [Deltaproteobacteria bacterium]
MRAARSLENLRDFIEVARGKHPADLVLKNGKIVNVLSGEIHDGNIAIWKETIAGIGDYQSDVEVDLRGSYVAPGFIDGHVHVESSKLLLSEYARAVIPRGTTAAVIDPHEIANVLGVEGIRFMLASSRELPASIYVMLSSCVPATNLETSGHRLSAAELVPLLEQERVLGIAEVMNYPGVLAGDGEVLEKILLGGGRRVDGHAPGLTGKDLCAYIGAGIRSDHECTTAAEARDKLRLGMYVMIREGSVARNLADLLPAVTAENSRRVLFASDDRGPEDLWEEGHLDFMVRKAVSLGMKPVTAIQIATINAAAYFGLEQLGAVAPGYQADLVVLEDLERLRVLKVFKGGRLVAEEGKLLQLPSPEPITAGHGSFSVDWSGLSRLSVAAQGERIRVMELIPGQILNRSVMAKAKVEDGFVVSDPDNDILKLSVVERHHATGNVGVGFVKGFGLKGGALGSSVAHDSHNIIVVGASDEEMKAAACEVADMGGGQVVVKGGSRVAALPLPVAGLMSDRALGDVVVASRELKRAAQKLGCLLQDPFMALSFLALPVIPELRITDRGLVDVRRAEFVPLFGES